MVAPSAPRAAIGWKAQCGTSSPALGLCHPTLGGKDGLLKQQAVAPWSQLTRQRASRAPPAQGRPSIPSGPSGKSRGSLSGQPEQRPWLTEAWLRDGASMSREDASKSCSCARGGALPLRRMSPARVEQTRSSRGKRTGPCATRPARAGLALAATRDSRASRTRAGSRSRALPAERRAIDLRCNAAHCPLRVMAAKEASSPAKASAECPVPKAQVSVQRLGPRRG